MADIGERMKMLLKSTYEDQDKSNGDTFGQRAEWYYQKRPQLLALLQDLYNGYTILLDRCNRMEGKHRKNSSLSLVINHNNTHFDDEEEEQDSGSSQFDWEAESSLSYQQHAPTNGTTLCIENMIADLVMKNVEKDILVHQLGDMEQQSQDSSRKIELLKKLLEVLESERVVLLNENARMGYKVTALLEENEGLSSEVMFLKKKVGELARCVLKMREDHRVCMLTRKIEDLQGQIYGLEMRNKEYYQRLLKREQNEETSSSSGKRVNKKNGGNQGAAVVGCFQLGILKLKKTKDAVSDDDYVNGSRAKWWAKVKSFAICGGLHQTSTAL